MLKNNPIDFQPPEDKLWGIYRGVVEENNDPEKMGRCKIRIFGVHTEIKEKDDLNGIPTDELPWAEPALSLFEGSVSGFGGWTVPLQGSHVFLFFENGHILNPRFFASAPGLPTDKNHGYEDEHGFSDPNEQYPTDNRLNEPDWHRLSRDESSDTIVDYKQSKLDKGIQLALGQGNWSEPDSYYLKSSEKYPNNIVYATHSGLIIEIDTSDDPRLHIYHPSNSYIEIDNEGNKIIKNNGHRYDIILKDFNKHTGNDDNTTIDNDKTKKIGNDEYTEIGNDKYTEIGNDEEKEIGNDRLLDIGNNEEKNIGTNSSITIGVNKDVTIGTDYNVNIGSNCNINVGANCNIIASGIVNVNGSIVNIN